MVYNKKKIAGKLEISLPTFNKLLKEVLSDNNIKKEFGKYRFQRFNKKQIQIIERETGFAIFNEYDP